MKRKLITTTLLILMLSMILIINSKITLAEKPKVSLITQEIHLGYPEKMQLNISNFEKIKNITITFIKQGKVNYNVTIYDKINVLLDNISQNIEYKKEKDTISICLDNEKNNISKITVVFIILVKPIEDLYIGKNLGVKILNVKVEITSEYNMTYPFNFNLKIVPPRVRFNIIFNDNMLNLTVKNNDNIQLNMSKIYVINDILFDTLRFSSIRVNGKSYEIDDNKVVFDNNITINSGEKTSVVFFYKQLKNIPVNRTDKLLIKLNINSINFTFNIPLDIKTYINYDVNFKLKDGFRQKMYIILGLNTIISHNNSEYRIKYNVSLNFEIEIKIEDIYERTNYINIINVSIGNYTRRIRGSRIIIGNVSIETPNILNISIDFDFNNVGKRIKSSKLKVLLILGNISKEIFNTSLSRLNISKNVHVTLKRQIMLFPYVYKIHVTSNYNGTFNVILKFTSSATGKKISSIILHINKSEYEGTLTLFEGSFWPLLEEIKVECKVNPEVVKINDSYFYLNSVFSKKTRIISGILTILLLIISPIAILIIAYLRKVSRKKAKRKPSIPRRYEKVGVEKEAIEEEEIELI